MPTDRQQHMNLAGACRLQTAYKTGRTNLLSNVMYSPITLNIRGIVNEEPHPDHTGQMVWKGSTNHQGECEWDTTFAVEPVSASVAPTWLPLLQQGMFGSAAPYSGGTYVSASIKTVLSCTVKATSALSVGKMILIETSAGSSQYNARQIIELSATAPTSEGRVVFWPALSAAPETSARIMPCRTLVMDDTSSDTAASLQSWLTSISRRGEGAVTNNITLNWGGRTHPMLNLTGWARSYAQCAPAALASAIGTKVATVIAVEDTDRVEEGFVMELRSGTTTLEMIRLDTRNDDGTFVVEAGSRGMNGTSASTQAAGLSMRPYKPSVSAVGSPVPAPYCCVTVGLASATVEKLEGTDGTFTLADGCVPDQQEFCDEWLVPSYGKSDGDARPEIQVTSKLDERQLDSYRANQDGRERGVVVQCGKYINNGRGIFGVMMPNSVRKMQESTAGDGKGSVVATLKWEGRGVRNGAKAVVLFIS